MKRTKNFEYETKRMKNDESITFKGKTDASYIEVLMRMLSFGNFLFIINASKSASSS